LLNIPNLTHEACPVGSDETANPVVREWGTKPDIAAPKDHVELAMQHGLVNWDDGTRVAGSGFVVYRGKVPASNARSSISCWIPKPPTATRKSTCRISSNASAWKAPASCPKFEDDMYGTDADENGINSLFLAPTAEVPVTNLYRDTLLSETDLPVKMVAYTPCFRREAGSAGRDNKGIIRMHQFDKVELVQIVHPDHGFEVLEHLTAHAESILQKLGLHYRTIELCTGDIGFSSPRPTTSKSGHPATASIWKYRAAPASPTTRPAA
jgi:seryl-tRNA synthetase